MGVGLQRCHDSFCGVRIGEATHLARRMRLLILSFQAWAIQGLARLL